MLLYLLSHQCDSTELLPSVVFALSSLINDTYYKTAAARQTEHEESVRVRLKKNHKISEFLFCLPKSL